MDRVQLQRKNEKLQLFLAMLICFFMSGFHTSYSQDEVLTDPTGTIVIGTSDSRIAATIIETEAGVIMQVIALGEVTFDTFDFSFFIKQSELAWSDKTFTAVHPYLKYSLGTSSEALFKANVELAPDMLKTGGKGRDFALSNNVCHYREAGLVKFQDGFDHWSDVEGMNALIISIQDQNSELHLPAGEMKHIFSCYFKKLHLGRALEKSDIGIGAKINGDLGGRFMPKWVYSGRTITYGTVNYPSGTIWERIRPELFLYRSSSSVSTSSVGKVTSITAVLNGAFKRGNISPANDLLDGRSLSTNELTYKGRLNWDKIIRNGFIYTDDATVTSLSVKEYTDSLFINGEGYLFPNSGEITAGEFKRGDYTLYIKMEDNSDEDGSVDYSLTLTDLKQGTTYSAWACIGYAFETSNEYFKIGDPLPYTTVCSLVSPPVTSSQSFCGAAKVSDLIATVAAGSVLEWYDTPTVGAPSLDEETSLADGNYYARASVGTCYSDSVKITVAVNTGLESPTAVTPQILCAGAKVSDLQATGSNIKWYDANTAGNLLSNTTPLENNATYYASQSNAEGCQSKVRKPVKVELGNTIPVPSVVSPQKLCGPATLADIATDGSPLKWYDASDNVLSSSSPLTLGSTYYAVKTAGTCESARKSVQIQEGAPATPNVTTPQIFCQASTLANIPVPNNQILWYSEAINGTLLQSNTPLVSGKIYYATQKGGSCESAVRAPVTVSVNPVIEIARTRIDTSFCSGESQVNLTVTAKTDNVSVLKYQWYKNGALITGATSAILTITAQTAVGNRYSVDVSNECPGIKTFEAFVGECVGECLDVIELKRDHTLVVDNNSLTNGGHTFEKYSWYRNDKAIAGKVQVAGGESRGGYYYAGDGKQLEAGTYYAEMWDKAGKKYRSCPVIIAPKAAGKVSAYPNPLVSSQVVYVDADLDEEALAKASIEIYSPLGSYIGKVNAQRLTPVRLPEEKGVYILKFRTEELEENFKIIVK